MQKFIANEPSFPSDPIMAIKEALKKVDDQFFKDIAFDEEN